MGRNGMRAPQPRLILLVMMAATGITSPAAVLAAPVLSQRGPACPSPVPRSQPVPGGTHTPSPDQPVGNPSPADELSQVIGDDRWLSVSLHGEYGVEITAPGVRNALLAAQRARVRHVVLHVDSPGGLLADGKAVGQAIAENRGTLVVHVVVERAMSAATWTIAEADHIWTTPSASTGAAVAFSMNLDTGAVEVDAKLNGALAAELASRAEANGHPGLLFRAMVLMEAEVWTHRDAEGAIRLTPSRPEGVASAIQLDGPTTVLSLTGKDMAELGLARPMTAAGDLRWPELSDTIPGRVGGDIHVRRGAGLVKDAAAATTREKKALLAVIAAVGGLASRVDDEMIAAREEDPRNITVWYKDASGVLTPQSQMEWRAATDRAVSAWRRVQQSLVSVTREERKVAIAYDRLDKAREHESAVRLIKEPPPSVTRVERHHTLDLTNIDRTASQEIERLLRNRTRYRIDQNR